MSVIQAVVIPEGERSNPPKAKVEIEIRELEYTREIPGMDMTLSCFVFRLTAHNRGNDFATIASVELSVPGASKPARPTRLRSYPIIQPNITAEISVPYDDVEPITIRPKEGVAREFKFYIADLDPLPSDKVPGKLEVTFVNHKKITRDLVFTRDGIDY